MIGPSAIGMGSTFEEEKDHALDAEIDKYLSIAEKCFQDIMRDPDNLFSNRYLSRAGNLYDKRYEEAGGNDQFHSRFSKLSLAISNIIAKNSSVHEFRRDRHPFMKDSGYVPPFMKD